MNNMKTISTMAALFLSTGAVAADLDVRALLKQSVDNFGPKPLVWVDANGKTVGREFNGHVVLTVNGDLVPVALFNGIPNLADLGKGANWFTPNIYFQGPNCTGPVVAIDGLTIWGFKRFAAVVYDLGANKYFLVELNTFRSDAQISSYSEYGNCTNDEPHNVHGVFAPKPGGFNIDLSARFKPPFFLQ